MPAPSAAPGWCSSQLRANGHDGTTVNPSDAARFLDGQEMILIGRHGEVHVFNIHALQAAAMTAGEFAAGVVNKQMAHGLGGGGEEMGAIFKGRIFAADQAHPDLMY